MKKLKIVQIIQLILLIAVAAGLIFFLCYVSSNNVQRSDKSDFSFDFTFDGKEKSFSGGKVKQEKVNCEGINKIQLDFDSADINVSVTDEENIKITEKSSKPLRNSELFKVNNQDGTLKVTRGQRISHFFTFFIGWNEHRIELEIPKKFVGDLEIHTASGNIQLQNDIKLNDLKIEAASGDLKAEGFVDVQNFTADFASGSIHINQINCSEYALETKSGEISADSLKGSGSVKVTSGDIKIKELIGGQYEVSSASGDITLSNVVGSGEISAASGHIRTDYQSIEEYAKIHASSGDIDIKLAENVNAEIEAECSSGEVEGNLPFDYKNKKGNKASAAVGQAPFAKLTADASSGDIKINRD